MRARTRSPRLPKVPDIQERLRAHIEANEQCRRWAQKGIELVAAGRIAEAKATQKRAERYLAKLRELERN